MGAQRGDRVVAIRNATEKTVFMYGRGTYLGPQEVPGWNPDGPGPGGTTWRVAVEAQVRDEMEQPQVEFVVSGRRTGVDNWGNPMGDTRTFEERVAARLATIAANPCIQLDTGGRVWGYFCWWGPEAMYDNGLRAGRAEEIVPLPHPLPRHPLLG